MNAKKAALIILLALIVAMGVLVWGLAAKSGDGSTSSMQKDPAVWLEWLEGLFPEPDPTPGAAFSGPCVQGSGKTRTARWAKGGTCQVAVAGADGVRVRRLQVSLRKGARVKVAFSPRGNLPGTGKSVTLPDEEDGEKIREIDFRIPEDGADFELKCLGNQTCEVRLDGFKRADG